jgi:hypothetical protein
MGVWARSVERAGVGRGRDFGARLEHGERADPGVVAHDREFRGDVLESTVVADPAVDEMAADADLGAVADHGRPAEQDSRVEGDVGT